MKIFFAGKAADSYQRLSNAILASAKARAVQDRLVEQAKQKIRIGRSIGRKRRKNVRNLNLLETR